MFEFVQCKLGENCQAPSNRQMGEIWPTFGRVISGCESNENEHVN